MTFYGAVFTKHGMKPNPLKEHALQDLPTPTNQKELQSLLCLINYLQPFIPYFSDKTAFLRAQITNWN